MNEGGQLAHRDAIQPQVEVGVALGHQVAVDGIQQGSLSAVVEVSHTGVGDGQLQGSC